MKTWKSSIPKRFPALVEQLVKQRSAQWDVAVVGSQGYSTSQELLAFRNYHEVVSPDVVLLCFYCGNDFEDNLRSKFAYLDDDGELRIAAQSRAEVEALCTRGSTLVVRVLARRVPAQEQPSIDGEHQVLHLTRSLPSEADQEYKQRITEKLLSKLAEEVRPTGAKFGVVVIPFRDDLLAGKQESQSFVRQVCADNQIAHLDLSPLLDRDDFFETDIHFNVRGHEIVAHAIDDFVADSLAQYR